MVDFWQGTKPTVAIIGAGFGGLCMGVRLKQAGNDSFTIFEKGTDVGGIWRDNTYPGCGCDVPSHLYSFSFEKYRSSTCRYPAQEEILAYLRRVAQKYDLRPHLRLGTEVTAAHFDEARGHWVVTTASGEQYDFDVVIYAVGQLNRPRLPEIPGRDTFEGASFHTARWDHDYELSGRDVAVVGTGSSAAQLVPYVARTAHRLYVFQRTANWVIPKPAAEFPWLTRLSFEHMPALQLAYRGGVYLAADEVLWPVITRGWSSRPVEWLARRHLRGQVPDPQLRQKLTPDHPIGCKRIVIDSDFYPALTRRNVELITEKISRITPTGIETDDRVVRKIDAIVYATGFRTTEFLAPIQVHGRNGKSLHDQWRGGAEAYLGISVPGFPNLFIIHGPNTILGHNSNVYIIECQVRYIMQCLRLLPGDPPGAIEVRPEAMTRYMQQLEKAIDRTVWKQGCLSWYKTESGKVTNPWPGSTRRYRRLLRSADPEAFRLVPASGVRG
jgi:cation diffusion facilitator CzcD-associated flavoprotein CzcO